MKIFDYEKGTASHVALTTEEVIAHTSKREFSDFEIRSTAFDFARQDFSNMTVEERIEAAKKIEEYLRTGN